MMQMRCDVEELLSGLAGVAPEGDECLFVGEVEKRVTGRMGWGLELGMM